MTQDFRVPLLVGPRAAAGQSLVWDEELGGWAPGLVAGGGASVTLVDNGDGSATIASTSPAGSGTSGPYTPAKLLRTNLALRPVPEGAEGWTGSGANYTRTLDTAVTRRPGTASAKIVRVAASPSGTVAQWNYAGQTSALVANALVIDPTKAFTATIHFRVAQPGRGRVQVTYYNASNGIITTGIGEYVDLVVDGWVPASFTGTPPAGTVRMQVIGLVALPAGGTTVGGETAWAQDLLLEQDTTGDYFDGSYPNTSALEHSWSGTPNASTSHMRQPASGTLPLLEWALSGTYEVTAITATDPSTGQPTTATVTWPDGSTGTFTGVVNQTFGGYDSYTITHTVAGQKVTQAAVTRAADGSVTSKPALTIGAI